jgi:hypothetical protein
VVLGDYDERAQMFRDESSPLACAQALGAGACVRKPFTLETLAVAVRDELLRRV